MKSKQLTTEILFESVKLLSPPVKASLFLFLMMASVKYLTGEIYGFWMMYLMATIYGLDEFRRVIDNEARC